MSKCPGLHCKGCGDGGGIGIAIAVIVVALVIAAIAKPVEHAAVDVLHFLEVAAIVTGCVVGAGLLGAGGWLVVRRRRIALTASERPAPVVARVHAAAPVAGRTEPTAAIPARPQELHLHLHGVSAADVAAITRQLDERR